MAQKSINLSAVSGDQVIFTADAATAHTDLTDFCIIVSAAGTVILKDGAGTEYGRYTFANAGDGIVRPPLGSGNCRFSFRGNLVLNLSTSMTVTGDFTYTPRTAA